MNKPLCPYCGTEMDFQFHIFDPYCEGREDGAFLCPHCEAVSPAAATEEEALELARRMYEPPAKPLTRDQFNAIYSTREDHVWPFDACPPYLFLESAIEKNDFCWISWGVAKTLFEQGYRAYSSNNYGEKWRFWTRKPTDEERRASAWQTT